MVRFLNRGREGRADTYTQAGWRTFLWYRQVPWMQKSLYFFRHGFLFLPFPFALFLPFPLLFASVLSVSRMADGSLGWLDLDTETKQWSKSRITRHGLCEKCEKMKKKKRQVTAFTSWKIHVIVSRHAVFILFFIVVFIVVLLFLASLAMLHRRCPRHLILCPPVFGCVHEVDDGVLLPVTLIPVHRSTTGRPGHHWRRKRERASVKKC